MAVTPGDLLFGFRMFRRAPMPVLVGIISMALATGANTAIFSVIRAALLRALPYHDPNQLVALWESNLAAGVLRETTSPPNYIDWRDQNDVFENVAAYAYWVPALISRDREAEQLLGIHVTGNFFGTLGVRPALGRDFLPEEDRPGFNRAVILSDGFWQRRFGKDPNILGRTLILDGAAYKIVGVMPAGLEQPQIDLRRESIAVWRPMALEFDPNGRRSDYLRVIARMKPGIGLSQARAHMTDLTTRLARQYPQDNTAWESKTVPISEAISGNARRPLWLMLGAVGMLLLIACVNVATLLLGQATERRHEFAIRGALGAQRIRLIRQVLTESIVLSIAGALLSFALSRWISSLLYEIAPHDPATFISAIVLLAGVSTVAMLIPARRATGLDPLVAIRTE